MVRFSCGASAASFRLSLLSRTVSAKLSGPRHRLGGDEDPDRVREAYGDSVYDRLVDVKTTYDPDNVFHHNQNIRPVP
jgi:hypothetical protein